MSAPLQIITARRAFLFAILIALAWFAGVAPTLRSLEFSSGSENLLTATVIEMHAGGPWLAPNLHGEPRVRKPPLPAWIHASLIPKSIINRLDSPDQSARDEAYRDLALAMRWPAALMSCLIILATFEIARTLADNRIALISAAVCASTLLLLRFGRAATTDIHLAFWVAMANLCLVKWIIRGKPVWGLPAGAALGLAFMSKGPVGLVQSVVPAFALIAWLRFNRKVIKVEGEAPAEPLSSQNPSKSRSMSKSRMKNEEPDPNLTPTPTRLNETRGSAGASPSTLLFTSLGILIFLAIALPWFIYVLRHTPGAMQLWKTEVFREGATSLERDPFYSYVSLFGVMAPWVAFFIAGGIGWLASPRTKLARSAAVMFTFVPVIIMSCFKDKNERYLVPMVVPAAILAATAIAPLFRPRELWNRAERALFVIQCIIIGGMAIGLPLVGVVSKNGFGGTWWSPATSVIFAAILIPLAIAAIVRARRQAAAMVGGTMLLMLAAHAMFLEGYRQTAEGRSEIKPLVDRLRELTPTAQIYYTEHRDPPRPPPADLQIYANRIVRAIPNTTRPPTDGHVIVFYQRDGEPIPEINGYRMIANHVTPKRAWHAFTP